MIRQQKTINARGKLIDLASPLVMGVLNITPDSFFDGGVNVSVDKAVETAAGMLDAKADIIDIGGMSSRPGAQLVSAQEEIKRISPVIKAITSEFPNVVMSIDTIHSETAEHAMGLGVQMINDISGGRYDVEIVNIAARYNAPFVCMHMQGMPKSMQASPSYNDVTYDVLKFFVERVKVLRDAGVKDIILDPGFGFGKTDVHNYQLLKNLSVFNFLELPILVGISRKSMICRVLEITPAEALNGTSALHMVALQNGASILRVHDVKEARQVIDLQQFYFESSESTMVEVK